MLIVRVLENNNYLSILDGEFDYGYNFAPDDRTVGTFAVGSTEDAWDSSSGLSANLFLKAEMFGR